MTALVQIDQGTAPGGSGGDTVRSAFAKVNVNTAAIAAQVPLVTVYLAASKALDLTYIGKRVCLNFGSAGGAVTMPAAASVGVDGCVLLWNLNSPVAVALQGKDNTEVTTLNAGDWALYVSDGNTVWHVQQRGRNAWNETVGGNLAVGGTLSAVGAISSGGDITATGRITTSGNLTVNGGTVSVPGALGQGSLSLGPNDGFFYGSADHVGWFSSTKGSFYYYLTNQTFYVPNLGVSGSASFGARPSFAGNTPWDSGNLPSPASITGAGFSGVNSFGPAGPIGGASLSVSSLSTSQLVGPLALRSSAAAPGKYWSVGPDTSNNFVVYNQGNVGAYMADGGTAWVSNSDENLKDVKGDITGALERVGRLRAVIATWKSDVDRSSPFPCVIAQDVVKVLPEACAERDGVLGVRYSELIPLLIAAINELHEKFSELEAF